MDTLSVADVMALRSDGGDNDMWGGGMWIFFLFILLLFTGGFGGFGGNGGNALNQINNDFMYTNLSSQLNTGFTQQAQQNFALQKDVYQGQAQTQMQIAECCCTTNRNIDAVRYENAKNTCEIITAGNMNTRDLIANQTANTQAIIDKMTAQEIQNLRDQNLLLNSQVSQYNQTNTIINAVRPFPQPSYITCNPYTANTCMTGCGC